jgi:carboxymethylenebutenolidase
MTGKLVKLAVADGTAMQAYASPPPGKGPFPGLIVFQEAFGVNRHIRAVADRFASEGWITVAPELFHRTAPPGYEAGYGDFASVAPHLQAVTEAGLGADIRACWDWLRQQAQARSGATACIGYCLGGRAAFLANAILPFRAAVSYYGGRIVPEIVRRAPDLHGPMLFFWGGLDRHIPPEQVAAISDALGKAGKPFVSVVISDADHGFFCDERASYNPAAAAQSWALTLAFLKEKLR